MKTKTLLTILGRKFPKNIAKKHHDFVGHMTGELPQNVERILLCLDVDWEILPTIKKVKPDLIISHHPFIYGTKYRVFKWDLSKKQLCEEIDKLNIPIYSFHTNFDEAKDGMNDALANLLQLENIYAPEKFPMMRIGTLKDKMNVLEFARYAKECFNVSYSLLIAEGNKEITKVGLIGGGGSRYWAIAKEEMCDIYISGDIPHHVRREIVNQKFNFLDMPHEIEHVFMPQMKKILLAIDPSLEIVCVDHERLPEVIK